MERFHLNPPTKLHDPPLPSKETGEFLTHLAPITSTSFLSIGPCSPLQLWTLPPKPTHNPLTFDNLTPINDIDLSAFLLDGDGDIRGGDVGRSRSEDVVVKEKARLDAGLLMRGCVRGGLGVCTTSRGPLYLVDVDEGGGGDGREGGELLKVRCKVEEGMLGVFNVDVSSDGGWFGSCGKEEGLKVWKEGVGGLWGVVGETELSGVEFGSCVRILGDGLGGEVVVGGVGGKVFVVSGGEFVHTGTYRAHCGIVRSLDSVGKGGWGFVSGADDGLVNEWDLRERNVVGTMGGRGEVTAVSAGGPGGWYVGVGGRNGVTIWERRMRECVWSKDTSGEMAVWAITFCGDKLVWCFDDALHVLDCSNAEIANV